MTEGPDFKEVSPGVFAGTGETVCVGAETLDDLRRRARDAGTTQRLLLHPGVDDALHEMLIVHPRGIYIRPHLMTGSSKTYYVIDGAMTLVFFTETGEIDGRIRMGAAADGGPFIVRVMARRFHSLVVQTGTAAFVETLPGPFTGTVYAEWAPAPEDRDAARAYGRDITAMVGVREAE